MPFPLAALIAPVAGIIDKLIPDPEAKAKAKHDLLELAQKGELVELGEAASIIRAEAQSGSWMATNWRPLTMLVFVFIIANNYIIAPYMALFGAANVVLDVPPDLWDLIKIGLGGYVVGRSAEKGIRAWRDKE
jgi:hypothetical protein